MSAGCDEPSGSFPMGKERQPIRLDAPTEERQTEEKPDALIKKAVEAARDHLRRLAKPLP